MPDADKEDTINALVGACFGSSGQRCMAITTVVFVGDVRKIKKKDILFIFLITNNFLLILYRPTNGLMKFPQKCNL